MPITTAAMLASNNRRRGWVNSHYDNDIEDDGDAGGHRRARGLGAGQGFDPRKNVAVWNSGLGPSKDSIPSRKSSLASEVPGSGQEGQSSWPSTPYSPSSAEAGPSRLPYSPASSAPGTPTTPISPTGPRHARTPSGRIIGASAYSDHQRIMAAARSAHGSPSATRSPQRPGRRDARQQPSTASSSSSNHSHGAHEATASASSSLSHGDTGSSTFDRPSTGSSVATSPPASSAHGSDLEAEAKAAYQHVASPAASSPSPFPSSPSSHNNIYRKTNGSLLASVKPMPPVVERSTTPDAESALSSSSARGGSSKPKPIAKNGLGKRGDLRIELPPSRGYKSAYPAILVDSSHLNDDGDDDDDFLCRSRREAGDESDGDDSSWPSTPSTTPLEMYLASPGVQDAISESERGPMSDGAAVRAAYLTADSSATRAAQTSAAASERALAKATEQAEEGSLPRSTTTAGNDTTAASASTPPQVASSSKAEAPVKSTSMPREDPAASTQQALGRGRPTLSFDLPKQMPLKPSQEPPKKTVPESPRRPSAGFLARAATKLTSPKTSSKTPLSATDNAATGKEANQQTTEPTGIPCPPQWIREAEQRRSLEQERPAIQGKRRSFELRPILLNPTANQSRTSVVGSPAPGGPATATQPSHVHSGTNVGGLQYTKRSSDQSHVSSTASLAMPGRASDVSDDVLTASPRASTTITVPSPNLSSEGKQLQLIEQEAALRRPSTSPASAAEATDRYTQLPVSASRRAVLASSRAAANNEAELQARLQRELLQEHIDRQRGRVMQDTDSIVDWIEVSAKDLPDAGRGGAEVVYGNGGKGAYSNEQIGRRASVGGGGGGGGNHRPWRFGRFSASNVTLPQPQAANQSAAGAGAVMAKRKLSILRRNKADMTIAAASGPTVKSHGAASTGHLPNPSTGDVGNASKVSLRAPVMTAESHAAGKRNEAFTPNLGWTSANRNAALQELCQKRSVAGLAAACLTVASLGGSHAPFPVPQHSRPPVQRPPRPPRPSRADGVVRPPKSPERKHSTAARPKAPVEAAVERQRPGVAAGEDAAAVRNGARPPADSNRDRAKLLEQARHAARLDPASPTYGSAVAPGHPDFQPAYELTDHSHTVKSIHPEVGSWSIDDLDDEDDDAFIDSDSDDGLDSSDEEDDAEVPRQMTGFAPYAAHRPAETSLQHLVVVPPQSPPRSPPRRQRQQQQQAQQKVQQQAQQQENQEQEPSAMGVFFSSIRGAPESLQPPGNKAPSSPGTGRTDGRCLPQLSRKFSLRNGAVTNRGKEIRLCVQEPVSAPSGPTSKSSPATTAAAETVPVTWKAVRVQHLANSTCEDLGYLASRRAQARKTRAMSLEAEVQRGQFASFVGLSSPKRKGRGPGTDTPASASPGGGEVEARRIDDDEDLFISKAGGTKAYVVGRPDLPRNHREEYLEIVARASPTAARPTPSSLSSSSASANGTYHDEQLPIRYSVDEQSRADRDRLPGTPMFDLDRAFPSPLNVRPGRRSSQDSQRHDASAGGGSGGGDALGWTGAEVVQVHVRRRGLHGLRASFDASDGRRWFWRTNAPTMLSGAAAATSASGSATGIVGGSGLSGSEMQLFAMDGVEAVQLAAYSANSLPRNALGLFKPRAAKPPSPLEGEARQPVPAAAASSSAPVPPLPRSGQLGPQVGMRGAKPIRSHAPQHLPPSAAGPGLRRGHSIMQNRRAAVSTDSVVRKDSTSGGGGGAAHTCTPVTPDAGAGRRSMDSARPLPSAVEPVPSSSSSSLTRDEEGSEIRMGPQKRMGDVKFLGDCYDHDLATVTLLALLGMVKV
ncbi:uncharacterized protein PSFLO_02791 [Pseudozyma flocculosa]|uniref:Uncharacterized protein n=1 Tax=Pseudozyma flocculosa TaxID=84751 RepID=A0A5C3EYK6_9BASI|nr:uncharacterized protein PSFLO_02791 [Pseudozyma flocculosa]